MSLLRELLIVLVTLAGGSLGWLRWLRVAQREHYLAGSTMRFAWRWWSSSPVNELLALVALVGLGAAWWWPWAALATGAVVAAGPRGLSVKGRSTALHWTRRLKTLAAVSAGLTLVAAGIGVVIDQGAGFAATLVFVVPGIIDLAAFGLKPLEVRASRRFIEQAATRLRAVNPTVVGITGSFGKTSTKHHVTALVGAERTVVPSPRSFNNRAGLARAINEHLADGTQVFVAEMGTYGPGEIAAMVEWCPPEIAVITAIGPVHLERFGSLDAILKAKAEIVACSATVVLNVDDPRLSELASSIASTKRVISASSTRTDVDVAVIPDGESWQLSVQGREVGRSTALLGLQPSNVACAMAVAWVLGASPEVLAQRVERLTAVENRLTVGKAASGATVVDDTFNANPAGALAALATLVRVSEGGRRVVVTPGMIELGARQFEENERFAERAATLVDTLVIVGSTNARALRRGASRHGDCAVVGMATREHAVSWVRANLGARDAVLYENDLPDHYP
jgi:UDP-N-acetylmuramoyl-tripeptide--D-alanyl-D-alanine ligase